MKARKMLCVLSALVLLLAVPAAVVAARYGYAIDVDAMKALEASCSFPVCVTEKKIVRECFDVKRLSDESPDALVVTVHNGTDRVVTGLKVGIVAYDEGNLVRNTVRTNSVSYDASPEITYMIKSDISLAPGESCIVTLRVNYSCFSGVRAMVAEYTTEDGASVANLDFGAWQNLAFGLAAGDSTELD